MKQKLLLIDGWNVIIAQNAVAHIEDHNTYPIGMYLTTLNQIKVFVEKFKPAKVVFTLDGPDSGERRRELLPEYKNGRHVKKRESKVQIMEGEDNIVFGVEGAFQNQLIKIYEFLKLLPVSLVILPGCEADDTIAYLALKNKEEYDVVIISNDKDYLQLIQEGISVYRWKAKKLYGVPEFISEFNILPENYIYRKIIMGDTGDVVKGIKGIGEKTFKLLEKPLRETVYKDIHEFLEMIKNLDKSEFKTKERNALNAALETEEQMSLSYSLMKLNEKGVSENEIQILKSQLEQQESKGLARLSAKVKMSKNFFNKLYKGFNDDKWLQTFAFLRPNIKIKA